MIINKRRVLINQGELYCSVEPRTISTILGSCVAVCLFDEVSGCGGMNHFVMPRSTAGVAPSPRCGDIAIVKLVQDMIGAGSSVSSLKAKLFGGAVPPWVSDESRFAVGAANVEAAQQILHQMGIPILAQRTGGGTGMKIYFDSWSGNVRVRQIDRRPE